MGHCIQHGSSVGIFEHSAGSGSVHPDCGHGSGAAGSVTVMGIEYEGNQAVPQAELNSERKKGPHNRNNQTRQHICDRDLIGKQKIDADAGNQNIAHIGKIGHRGIGH